MRRVSSYPVLFGCATIASTPPPSCSRCVSGEPAAEIVIDPSFVFVRGFETGVGVIGTRNHSNLAARRSRGMYTGAQVDRDTAVPIAVNHQFGKVEGRGDLLRRHRAHVDAAKGPQRGPRATPPMPCREPILAVADLANQGYV